MRSAPRILIAGIGNIFLGDDAFGVRVVQRLMQEAWPGDVRIADFGIRGLDLVYALLDGPEWTLLVDAVPRGQAPGTLFLIEPEISAASEPAVGCDLFEGHSMDPAKVLRMVGALKGRPGHVLLLGCEPAPLDSADDMKMGLSPPVTAAIEPACRMVRSLVDQKNDFPFILETEHEDNLFKAAP